MISLTGSSPDPSHQQGSPHWGSVSLSTAARPELCAGGGREWQSQLLAVGPVSPHPDSSPGSCVRRYYTSSVMMEGRGGESVMVWGVGYTCGVVQQHQKSAVWPAGSVLSGTAAEEIFLLLELGISTLLHQPLAYSVCINIYNLEFSANTEGSLHSGKLVKRAGSQDECALIRDFRISDNGTGFLYLLHLSQ